MEEKLTPQFWMNGYKLVPYKYILEIKDFWLGSKNKRMANRLKRMGASITKKKVK